MTENNNIKLVRVSLRLPELQTREVEAILAHSKGKFVNLSDVYRLVIGEGLPVCKRKLNL